jgi:hypothetical protein
LKQGLERICSGFNWQGAFTKSQRRTPSGCTFIDCLADMHDYGISLGTAVIDKESGFLGASLVMSALQTGYL